MQSTDIVIIKRSFGVRGGLEKYTKRLIDEFGSRNQNVTLLTTSSTPIDGVTQVQLPSDEWWSYKSIQSFDRACKSWLETHPHHTVLGMDRTRNQTHIRAGNGVHQAYLQIRKQTDPLWKNLFAPINPVNRLILDIERQAFESPSLKKLYTNSYMVKNQVLEAYDTPSDRIEVVHNGVEWHDMASDFENWPHEREKLCNQLGIDRSSHHLLFIGNGYHRKGLEPLLHALSHFSEKDFHLTIIGKEKNPKYFKRLAEELGLKAKTSFLSVQQNIRRFYQMADTFVLPSFYDPFANVTVEALAMGLFTLTSCFNGGKEVIDSTNGYIFDPMDVATVADALEVAWTKPKTEGSSRLIRESVKHLDFSKQLRTLVDSCLYS